MNDTSESSETQGSAFLPIVLLSLALSFFFLYQISNLREQGRLLDTDFKNLTQQIDQQVKQSQLIQAGLETIVRQLLDLANSGDADAKKIVEKYGIKVNLPAGAPAPPK